jgi:hypothetical protein
MQPWSTMQILSAYISLQLAFRFRLDHLSAPLQTVFRSPVNLPAGFSSALVSLSLQPPLPVFATPLPIVTDPCSGLLALPPATLLGLLGLLGQLGQRSKKRAAAQLASPSLPENSNIKKTGSSPHGDDPGQMKRWQNRLMMALKRLGSAAAIAGGQARIEPGPLLRRSGAVQERSRSTPGAAVLQHSWSRPECSARFQRSKPALLPIPPSPSCAGRRPVARWLPRLFFLPGRHGRNCSIPTRCSGLPARCPAPPASA